MSRQHAVPDAVVAAIAAVLSQMLGVPPERLRIGLSGEAPADDARGAWQLHGVMEQMRGRGGAR